MPNRRCARCGYLESEHKLANFADGAQIGEPVLICPVAVFDPYEGPSVHANAVRHEMEKPKT